MTCAYYRMKFPPGNLWALRVEYGRIIAAVGPLPESAMSVPPMAHKAVATIDASAWTLDAFTLAGNEWELKARNRIGGGKIDHQENENGFSIRLVPNV